MLKHGIYLLIIGVLLWLLFTKNQNHPTSSITEIPAPSIEAPVSPINEMPEPTDNLITELREAITTQQLIIEELRQQLASTETEPPLSGIDSDIRPQELTEGDFTELVTQRHIREQEQRRNRFNNADPDAWGDSFALQLESEIYTSQRIPAFETMNIECKAMMCDLTFQFYDSESAQEISYTNFSHIFNLAGMRSVTTRVNIRGEEVHIEADLAQSLLQYED